MKQGSQAARPVPQSCLPQMLRLLLWGPSESWLSKEAADEVLIGECETE